MKLEWRDENKDREASLFFGRVYVGDVVLLDTARRRRAKIKAAIPWQAWFMSSDIGERIGSFATVEEAKAAVEAAFNAGDE
jgi:hypothetical protein